MRILHVIAALPRAAGTTAFCVGACESLSSLGHDVTIAVFDHERVEVPIPGKVRMVTIPSVMGKACSYDIVHIHGIWLPCLHRVASWARRNGAPIMFSPHGMLAPWAMSYKWWKKFLPWYLYQRRDLRLSSGFHVTSATEAKWVSRFGFEGTCFEIPLGTSDAVARSNLAGRRVLFVGRIHEVKGLENLLRAWALVEVKEAWRLVLVGPDDSGYSARLVELASELGITESVEFAGPKFGCDLDACYSDATFLVLPSFTENFGGVVADAMIRGVPVIASTGTPWELLNSERCGAWVSNDPATLSGAIKDMMLMNTKDLSSMADRCVCVARDNFSWRSVGRQLDCAYRKVLL